MSIIDAAFKQSQTANNTEQAHLSYQQTKQLAFYKKLSLGLAGVGLSVIFALAGFYSGQYFKSQSQSVANVNNQQAQVEEVTGTIVKQESRLEESIERSQPVQEKQTAKVKNNQEVAHSDEQYQWMSVQVGLDDQGVPIFKQQLVPLSAIADVNNAFKPEQPQEDLSQYRVLGKPLDSDLRLNDLTGSSSEITSSQEDLSQYRVLGKPLGAETEKQTKLPNTTPSINDTRTDNPTSTTEIASDEASARLKAAFELAVAETADKDFTQAEPEDIVQEDERLSIEFLPRKTQAAIGKLSYQAHIYATSEHKRWIKINGVELYEGDKINGMRLLEIAPEESVFRFQGYDFSVKAMKDWQPY